jgi:hypothetical protein
MPPRLNPVEFDPFTDTAPASGIVPGVETPMYGAPGSGDASGGGAAHVSSWSRSPLAGLGRMLSMEAKASTIDPAQPAAAPPVETPAAPPAYLVPVDHDPFNLHMSDLEKAAPANPIAAKLLGLQGANRYQLWPEKMARSGASLPGDVAENKFTRQPTTPGAWSDEDEAAQQIMDRDRMERVGDLANFAILGGMPLAPRGALGTSGGGPMVPQQKAPAFYSGVENAVESAPLKSASPEQWLGTLKNSKGVKNEEMQWLGLPEWLAEQKGPVTKEAVADFVRQNKVELKEVRKLGDETDEFADAHFSAADGYIDRWTAASHAFERGAGLRINERAPGRFEVLANDEPIGVLPNQSAAQSYLTEFQTAVSEARRGDGIENLMEFAREAVDQNPNSIPGQAKFERWTLPGGENYREILLTLPFEKAAPGKGVIDKMPDWQRPHARDSAYAAKPDQLFRSSHWDESNVLTHVRVNDRVLPRPRTAEETAAIEAREAARPDLDRIRAQENDVGMQIQEQSAQLEAARRTKIIEDMRAGRISAVEAGKKIEEFVEHPELKPLQDRLAELRAQEDAITSNLPAEPKPAEKKTLFIEEIQSDWHQGGRDRGYKTAGMQQEARAASDKLAELREELWHDLEPWHRGDKEEFRSMIAKAITTASEPGRVPPDVPQGIAAKMYEWASTNDKVIDLNATLSKGVPDAPFKKNWHELALKRMIREAAEKGYDQIAWPPGKVHADRFGLSNHLDQLDVIKLEDDLWGLTGFGKDHEPIRIGRVREAELPGMIGADLAKKIIEGHPKKGTQSYRGLDLEIGGEGMTGFYDKILVDAANRLGKPYGAKVSKSRLQAGQREFNNFQIKESGSRWKLYERATGRQVGPESGFANGGAAERWLMENKMVQGHEVHVLDITPEMRDAAVGKGFPLCMSGVPVIRIDHDPFAEDDAGKK